MVFQWYRFSNVKYMKKQKTNYKLTKRQKLFQNFFFLCLQILGNGKSFKFVETFFHQKYQLE